MNNDFPFHLWKKIKLQPNLKKELDVLRYRRTTSIWSGLRTGYSEKPQLFTNPLHSTLTPGSPTTRQVQC